jgi:hypothetical protein
MEALTRSKIAYGFRRARARYRKLQFAKGAERSKRKGAVGKDRPTVTVLKHTARARSDFEEFFGA